METAKLFMTGNSQAVRLPKAFQLPGKQVSIFRLGKAVVLQPVQESWLALYEEMVELEDFMADRDDLSLQKREIL